jgi:NADPH-ferrihemoprotein reductase
VSVIDQPKPDGGVFRGVCSSFLQALEPPVTNGGGKRLDESGSRRGAWPSCRVFVRPSSFRLPKDPKTPIVMIGPGTGIAPMRALLQERAHQRENAGEGGENVLYFGCKNREKDFLYREELEAFQTSGVLTKLHLAFSRENPKKKVYVQHLMKERENAAELWDLVNSRGAHLYVCGGTSMGTDVGKALAEVVGKLGGRDLAKSGAADAFVAKMKEEGRYVQELWS